MFDREHMVILDGGMGRELERMGAPFRQPEWSALALMDAPDMVRAAHESFIKAGADVIITNSYAVIPYHIGEERFAQQGAGLIKLSAQLAREAVKAAGKGTKVAGSIPPLFGSYLPDAFDPERAISLIKPFIEQQKDFVDVWLGETLGSIAEAKFVFDHLKPTGKPIWLSFNVAPASEGGAEVALRSGETIREAVRAFEACGGELDAILVNCSGPDQVTKAVYVIAEELESAGRDLSFGAYGNSFSCNKKDDGANEVITELRTDLTPELYLEYAQRWKGCGATIIGGCCGIGPEHIAVLSREMADGDRLSL